MSWGAATNGQEWIHDVATGCTFIDPLDGSPPYPRPDYGPWANDPYIGIVAHWSTGGLQSISRLPIAPLDPDDDLVEMSVFTWFENDIQTVAAELQLQNGNGSVYVRAALDWYYNGTNNLYRGSLGWGDGGSAGSESSGWVVGPDDRSLTIYPLRITMHRTGALEAVAGPFVLSANSSTAVQGLLGSSSLYARLKTDAIGDGFLFRVAFDDLNLREERSEVPSGGDPETVFGYTCKTFTAPSSTIQIPAQYSPGSVEIWVNGVYTTLFTEDPTARTVTLGFTPTATDTVRVCYIAVGP